MNTNQVIDKILSDAQAKANGIKAEAKLQADKIGAASKEQLDDYTQKTAQLVEKTREEKISHILAAARMEIAKKLLAEKKDILDKVFSQADEKLQKLSDNDYRDLMTKVMHKSIETGDEEIICRSGERIIDRKFVKDMNRQLGPGFKGNLRMSSDTADIAGGFILRRGKIKSNASLAVLLQQTREQLEIELCGFLFGTDSKD